jgi:acyl phosphate:glycerol-3-phosphate acyltransferase
MNVILQGALALIVGYLLGAIPIGYLVGRAWGVDVRQYGSGRTGGTNVLRATGNIVPFLLTGGGDILKGVVAVLVGRMVFGSELAAALAGVGVVIGHNWSVFLSWRGGAGGATAAAALTALSPLAGIIVVPLGLSILYFSRYASLATITVGLGSLIALVALAAFVPPGHPWFHVLFGAPAAFLLLLALRPNLRRLADGTERRITYW